MTSESTQMVYINTGVAYDEEKQKTSSTLECPVADLPDLPSPSDDFPEGGLKAWATAFGAFLVLFCGFGYITSFGVYEDFYTQHYLTNESSSAISWIGSGNTCLVNSVSLISGRLYDRGYFYHLIIIGSLLQSFSLFMLSFAKPNQYYQIFLCQTLCYGIGAGLTYIPSLAVVSHHFQRKRTVVMTFVIAGSSLGAIIHPIMLNNLLNGPVGFAKGVRASAGLVSGLLLIACLCMRTRIAPPTTPVNYIAAAKKCMFDVPLIFAIAGGFFYNAGFYYPVFFFQLDSIKHGINVTFSFYSLVILNVFSFIGRVTSGYIAAVTGVPNLIIVATVLSAVAIFGMIGLSNLTSVVVTGVLYGYFGGVYIALVAPLMTILTPDMSELGARMGISYFIGGFGGLIGSPIAGALLTSNYIWWRSAVFAGIIALVGATMYTISRFLFVRRQMIEKSL